MPYYSLAKNSVSETLKFPICADCEDIINVAIPKSKGFRNFRRFASSEPYSAIEYFARRGCALCKLVLAISQSPSYSAMNNNSSGGGAVSNVQRFLWSENQYADITILRPELAGIRGSNVPIQTHQIAKWSGSTASITLANKWVQNCINSHERCKPSTKLASSLPSRLLEIKFSKTRHRYCVRLCIANIPPNSKYATLSHVWGNLHFVKLLKSNFASFQKDIPISSLTRTFQDALKLALRVGFHYLWIDSL
ncbi:uncharacterized protein EAF02_001109 [Botrytis sinoallii]|uniref:uncharacterized protein n=1 Tax=Botrytis sinoallii TaxID=1463999 RepID=UPI0019022AA8|nr:uncharacterized protein EAF02_001109 [Botrytis sinoallii]KAF7893571.1 hypothetical protein EAF02_001109 [Botrytis sinoallii]